MALTKFVVLAVFLAGINGRYVTRECYRPNYFVDHANILETDLEDALAEQSFEFIQPTHLRDTRQIHGAGSTNPDGTYNLNAKVPLVGNDKNVLSAIGSISALDNNKGKYGAAGGGLALDNVNGHGLSVTKTHIPTFGDQLTAAGRVNLVNTPDHNLNANAFVTRNMPKFPGSTDFNTHGGSLDYMFKNKVGTSAGLSHTDLFKKTDYSVMGNANLFRNPTSSLDLNAGFTKTVSPFLPRSNWQPSAGVSFTKYW